MEAGGTSRYRILRRLGAGGMGEVFLAQDLELDRSVALKVLSAELAGDPIKRKRFRQEARAVSGLAHPNICVIHEVGETQDGRPFLAMEYVEGSSLDVLVRHGPLKPAQAIEVGLGVTAALEAAHARHIIHRDIKPGNIMLDRRGQVKVLDFGLAKRLAPPDPCTTSSSVHTQSGQLLGTPVYMSPEQLLGQSVDARTDLFSLGVVLYEALVGQRPFLGRTLGEVINNVVNQRPPPLDLSDAAVSAKVEPVVFKCLEKDPRQRYASARELAQDLSRLRQQLETPPIQSAAEQVPALAPAQPSIVQLPSPRRWRSKTRAIGLSVLVLLGLVGGVFLATRRASPLAPKGTTSAPVPQSVAVLPFENFSGEPDTDYLSDGLTEEITAALGRVPNLKIAARNSSFTFKGKKEDARRIAQALGVGALLEGSLRKAGNQVRVTADLINAADGFRLWSETYDGKMDDLLRMQEDIARRIAIRLQGQTNQMSAHAGSVDPGAHQLYLRGRLFWNKRTEPDLKQAIDLFKEALARDPDYAEAHAGLAAAYFVLQLNSINVQPAELRPLARTEANRALELDPTCATAHAVLAWLQDYARDTQGAEQHFRRAIELAPSDATAHQWFGLYYMYHGRLQEAWPELQAAAALDPLSIAVQASAIEWYLYKRDFDESIRQGRRLIERFPEYPMAYWGLVATESRKGDFAQALADADRARALRPDQPLTMLDQRAYALARLGREEEARQILDRFEQLRREGKRVDLQLAIIYCGFREYDHAVQALERMRVTEGLYSDVLYHPGCDELRGLPAFQALLERAGLTK